MQGGGKAMAEGIQSLLDRLWWDFAALNPQAQRIHQLLTDRGDRVVTDHIALRTFRHGKLGIDAAARPFERHGYTAVEDYEFPDHSLHARCYRSDQPGLPRIFISELELEALSRGLRDVVGSLTRQIEPAALPEDALVLGGCPWYPVLHDTYERLRLESEYAAWVAAFGFRANHFAVLVNELDSFDSLAAFNGFLEQQGFELEDGGGRIRGSAAQGLEQSSTVPTPCTVRFADAANEIPGGRYAFAWRHPLPSGELFAGFLADCAEWLRDSLEPGASPQPDGT